MFSTSSWIRVSLLLCTYGIFREIRPSEPYVSEFLLGEWRNITEQTLYQEVYPIGTYSYLLLLVFVFLLTDFLRYKPIIILSGLSGISVYCILLWTVDLKWLQISQIFYGLYMATEIAYYTYMFAKVEKEKYERVASHTRSAALTGRFLSGITAQILVSFDILNLRQLNYITLSSQVLATIWALFLPSVNKSVYFHEEIASTLHSSSASNQNVNGLKLLWEHLKTSYNKKTVIVWSIWYAFSSAGFFQVQSYIQLLWKEINPSGENLYNGIVEAVLTIFGAIAALISGYINRHTYKTFPALAAFIQAVAIFAASFATEAWISYAGYICFGITFHFMITIASFEIAKQLQYDSCFGLIFGINTLIALAIQSLLTFIVISPYCLELEIRDQFFSYAIYYSVTGVIAIFLWTLDTIIQKKKVKKILTKN